MNTRYSNVKGMKLYLVIASIIAWFALFLQLYLLLVSTKLSVPLGILRYFSFFTILTNILTALYFTLRSLSYSEVAPSSFLSSFFASSEVATAICSYMLFVGISYSLLLRHLWNPQGWQLIDDELLHTVLPLAVLIFWLIYIPKVNMAWTSFVPWLLYPVFYLVYALLISPIIGLYPYPFIDVKILGYPIVLRNSVMLLICFIILSLILIAIDRFVKKKTLI